jgi:hypothetical protein
MDAAVGPAATRGGTRSNCQRWTRSGLMCFMHAIFGWGAPIGVWMRFNALTHVSYWTLRAL